VTRCHKPPVPPAAAAKPVLAWLAATALGPGRRRRSRPGALRDASQRSPSRRLRPGRSRRAPFPLYGVEAWSGPTFVVEQDHVEGRLAELTVGFAETGANDHACVRVTSTRRPPSRTDERLARHLDPWLAAVVGEARGHDRLDLVADPEAVVELGSQWQTTTVSVDDEGVTFRVRGEDDAWVAYARAPDHAVIVCVEPAAPLSPETLRLATVRRVAALVGSSGPRSRGGGPRRSR